MKLYSYIFIVILIQILITPICNAQCTFTSIAACSGATSTAPSSGFKGSYCYTGTTTLAGFTIGAWDGAGILRIGDGTNSQTVAITNLAFGSSGGNYLYVADKATVNISGSAINVNASSHIINYGTITFSTDVTITSGTPTSIETASSTAKTNFTILNIGSTNGNGYISKGTTTTSGTVTITQNTNTPNICLNASTYWTATDFSCGNGGYGACILGYSNSTSIIVYTGTVTATTGTISSNNSKFCRNGSGTACTGSVLLGTVCSGSTCSSPLPVVFTNFSGFPNNNGINLSWTTAQEYNNDYFVVERSYNGIDFDSVKAVDGKGTSLNTTTYLTFDDEVDVLKPVYYRLKQVDFDGKYSYSSVIFINEDESKQGFTIYPNPVDESGTTLYAKFNETEINDNATVVLNDATGKEIQNYSINNIQSDYVYAIKDKNLFIPQGTYYLKIVTKSKVYTQKIVIK